MRIQIICVGKLKETYLKELIKYYSDIITRKISFQIIEVADEKTPDNASEKEEQKIKETEGKRILAKLPSDGLIIPLCIEGCSYSTEQFQKKWKQWKQENIPNVTFVIGGSLGLSQEVISRGKLKLSFSHMTFPHQLMRLILVEQISLLVI